ncbi:hypothetical protein LY78DRAFT_476278 [Colletotrichum sublineola]|nr:hypothetical protein LY78DRAFT_476278 [Colletotrichum sublineola]
MTAPARLAFARSCSTCRMSREPPTVKPRRHRILTRVCNPVSFRSCIRCLKSMPCCMIVCRSLRPDGGSSSVFAFSNAACSKMSGVDRAYGGGYICPRLSYIPAAAILSVKCKAFPACDCEPRRFQERSRGVLVLHLSRLVPFSGEPAVWVWTGFTIHLFITICSLKKLTSAPLHIFPIHLSRSAMPSVSADAIPAYLANERRARLLRAVGISSLAAITGAQNRNQGSPLSHRLMTYAPVKM